MKLHLAEVCYDGSLGTECDEVCRVCVCNSVLALLGHQLDIRIRGAVKKGSSSGRCSDDA